MNDTDVLVAGATGLLGGEIARLACEAGHRVRGLVRVTSEARKVEQLRALPNLELSTADLKDPASLALACRGVKAVVSTASATLSRQEGDSIETVDERGQLALIEAAQRAGVRRFVFVSFAPLPVDSALQRAKRSVEERLRESGLEYCILQPTFFSEIWLGPHLGFDPVRGRVRLFGEGTHRVSWISFRDVARFALAALEREQFNGLTLPLGGPDALSQLDVVRIFEELGAPPAILEYLPEAALEAQLAGAKDAFEEAYAALTLSVARAAPIDIRPGLALLDGRLVTVRDLAHGTLQRSKEKHA